MRSTIRRAALLGAVFLALCAAAAAGEEPLAVFVGIPPFKNFVERIGGPRVNVQVLVPPGRDPHTFEPQPRQMVALRSAQLLFLSGLPFEMRLAAKIGADAGRLQIIGLAEPVACEHEHEHGDHLHGVGEDPHTWLAPAMIREQVAAITAALKAADPEYEVFYSENLTVFLGELAVVEERVAKTLAPHRGEYFYVFHPAFGRFGEAFGLQQVAIEAEGKRPSPRQLGDLIARARAEGVRIIFVQAQFDPRAARTVAEAIGGAVVSLDPLAEDVLGNLVAISDAISAALAGRLDE